MLNKKEEEENNYVSVIEMSNKSNGSNMDDRNMNSNSNNRRMDDSGYNNSSSDSDNIATKKSKITEREREREDIISFTA
jgi:hypothetical protein